MSEYYLVHAGVSKRDGAKVGSGRYPLGSGKRPHQHDQDSESRGLTDEAKQEIINSGDLKAAFENRLYMTNADIDAVIARNDHFQKLATLDQKNVKTGEQKVQEMTSKINTATKVVDSLIGVYNVGARVTNAFTNLDLPTIKGLDQQPSRLKKFRTDIADKEKKKVLDEMINSGDLKKVLENQSKFTNTQLKEAHDRAGIIRNIEKQVNNSENVNTNQTNNSASSVKDKSDNSQANTTKKKKPKNAK